VLVRMMQGLSVGGEYATSIVYLAELAPKGWRSFFGVWSFWGSIVGTLTVAMELHAEGRSGLAMGAWGGVHATAAGLAILGGGVLRDVTTALAESGALGPGLTGPEAGYLLVYHLEILALFLAVGVLGPMVRRKVSPTRRFGLAELPG